jgi:hypothetical protein
LIAALRKWQWRERVSIMGNHVEMGGYIAFGVAGLSITASLLSLGLTTDAASVATPVTLGAFGVSLLGVGLFAVQNGQLLPHAVAQPLSHHEIPAETRDDA